MSLYTDVFNYNPKCVFCYQNDFYLYRSLFSDCNFEDFIIYKTPNFIVLPDIAPMVEGYLLIIPLTHYSCFGRLPKVNYEEFYEVKNFVTQLLRDSYTDPIFFEHGPAQPKHAGCCIEHAHIHCIPLVADISSIINGNIIRANISSITDLCYYTEKMISYLYYENNNVGIQYVYPLTDKYKILPSQYLRRVLAESLSLKYWNWREMVTDEKYQEQNKKRIFATITKLKKKAPKILL